MSAAPAEGSAPTLDDGIPLDGAMLKRLTTADAEAFAAHVAGDVDHLGEFLPWPAVTTEPPGAAGWLARYEPTGEARAVAAGAWRDDALIGGGVLFHHEPAQATIELGIWMTAGAEGRGLASAVCRVLLGVARREIGAERVVWQTATGNGRSRRLAERLGFVYEGTLRSSAVLRGRRLDIDVLSLVGAEIDAALEPAA